MDSIIFNHINKGNVNGALRAFFKNITFYENLCIFLQKKNENLCI